MWKKLIQVVHDKKIGKILHAEIIWNVETFAVSNNLESWKINPEETMVSSIISLHIVLII